MISREPATVEQNDSKFPHPKSVVLRLTASTAMLNNPVAYFTSIWSWHFPCTDADAVINKNYRDLVLETKGSSTPIPDGQRFWFNQRTNRGDSVLVVRGDPGRVHPDDVPRMVAACGELAALRREPPRVESIELWGTDHVVPATMADLNRLVGEFKEFAAGAPRPCTCTERWRPAFLVPA